MKQKKYVARLFHIEPRQDKWIKKEAKKNKDSQSGIVRTSLNMQMTDLNKLK